MTKVKAKKFRVLKPFLFRGVHRKPGDLMIIVEHKIAQIDSANIEEIGDKEYEKEIAEGKSVGSPKPVSTPAPEAPKAETPEPMAASEEDANKEGDERR